MLSNKRHLVISLVITALIFIYLSAYTVREGQRAIVLFLGNIVMKSGTNEAAIKQPGLHFKLPLLESVRTFDMRLQTKVIEESRFVTAEKKDVLVSYYIKWQISNIPQYFISTGGNALSAETLLEQKLNDGLRAEFGKRTIREVVSSERIDMMKKIQQQASESAKDLGIRVVDVRIKGIDLPPEVSNSVYRRMAAERKRIAAEHRATGKSLAEAIRAKADADVTIIIARAESDAKRIRGQGDAEAANIYAAAYGKDPGFYAFMRSLNAYRNSFNTKEDFLLLKPSGDFFKYFNHVENGNHKDQ